MIVLYFLCGFTALILILRRLWITCLKERRNVCVVVLGDLGRSPRMQYHALSLAKEGYKVDFIGYPGSPPLKEIRDHSLINIYYLSPVPALENVLPNLMQYVVKVLWQSISLAFQLLFKPISNYVLIQNPPAIPTIPLCWFYCILSEAEFLIDWHNYAYSLMALRHRKDHGLVKFAKFIETFFGAKACNNFCVTKAMKEDLQKNWNIKAQVLYDRPTLDFSPISLLEKHNLFLKLGKTYDIFQGSKENTTAFTEYSLDELHLSLKRPGLVVSSTSWTEDEDFSILINALQEYEDACVSEDANLPNLICVITGKGPLKEFYIAIIKLKKWVHVTIVTPWLENEDYPKILASADLGICLHTSSSGLDLPMKVVDMFGCGLPVCAYNYSSLSELVKHGENSYVFSNENELAEQIKLWFHKFPTNEAHRSIDEDFRKELKKFQEIRWHDNWTLNALPYFNE